MGTLKLAEGEVILRSYTTKRRKCSTNMTVTNFRLIRTTEAKGVLQKRTDVGQVNVKDVKHIWHGQGRRVKFLMLLLGFASISQEHQCYYKDWVFTPPLYTTA